jgi:hypothetical protein
MSCPIDYKTYADTLQVCSRVGRSSSSMSELIHLVCVCFQSSLLLLVVLRR